MGRLGTSQFTYGRLGSVSNTSEGCIALRGVSMYVVSEEILAAWVPYFWFGTLKDIFAFKQVSVLLDDWHEPIVFFGGVPQQRIHYLSDDGVQPFIHIAI